MTNQQIKNYTPIIIPASESFIHKAFTYDLVKNKYIRLAIVIGTLIYGIFTVMNYFSKENICRREVKRKVELAGKLVGVENPYLQKKLIEEESKKCLNK